MDRRHFFRRAMTGMAGVTTALGFARGHLHLTQGTQANQTVAYEVKGFTCVTCATGLEVMLLRQQGVARADASYPEAKVVIQFDSDRISEEALKEFILSCGFSALAMLR